jgi:hypothetical protein
MVACSGFEARAQLRQSKRLQSSVRAAADRDALSTRHDILFFLGSGHMSNVVNIRGYKRKRSKKPGPDIAEIVPMIIIDRLAPVDIDTDGTAGAARHAAGMIA